MSKGFFKSLEEFKEKFISLHGDKVDFSLANYKNSASILNLRCKVHGKDFSNSAYHVIRGAGCRECRREKIHRAADKKRLGNDVFKERSIKVHGFLYDYSMVKYKSLTDPVEIICNSHGVFLQKPREHFRGYGCQLCSETTISAVGLEWLSSLGIDSLQLEYRIDFTDKWYFVDGFDSSTNTVYEFYGDYWHGNPKTTNHNLLNEQVGKSFGDLYKNTVERENNIKSLGYNFISMWESEYNDSKNI